MGDNEHNISNHRYMNQPATMDSFRRKFLSARLNRLRRSDHTRSVEAKQLDDGIGDTFVLVSLYTRMINPQYRALISRQRVANRKGRGCLPRQLVRPNTAESIWTNVPVPGMADALFLIQGGERTARSAAGAGHDGADIGRQTNTKV